MTTWICSSKCDTSACVEVAMVGDVVLVRNSNVPDVVAAFDRKEWKAFIHGAKESEFDVPT